MKIIIYVFLVPLAVILLCVFLYNAIKALWRQSCENLRAWWRHKWGKDKEAEITDPAGMVETITITKGVCDCCGRTFVGTTSDKDSPLQIVKFMGISRNICSDCLKKLFAQFKRENRRGETLYSDNAKKLKDMLDNLSSHRQ